MEIVKNKIYQYKKDKQYYIVIEVSKDEVSVLSLDHCCPYFYHPVYFKSNFKSISKLKETLLKKKLPMKVYKHKNSGHYYVAVYKITKDSVYTLEWDKNYLFYWDYSVKEFRRIKKHLKPVLKIKRAGTKTPV